jgi:hypothetical protein
MQVFWRARLGYLQETCRRLVTYPAVARVLLVWNNRDLPVPPCFPAPNATAPPHVQILVVRPPAAVQGR